MFINIPGFTPKQSLSFRGMENSYKNRTDPFYESFAGLRFVWSSLLVVLSYFLLAKTPSELAPMEDRSQFRIQVSAPEGTAFDAPMDKYIDRLNKLVLDSVPEKKTVLSLTAPGFASGAANSGFVRVALEDPKERDRSQKEIVEMVNRNFLNSRRTCVCH
jgi:multidrug efflux pump